MKSIIIAFMLVTAVATADTSEIAENNIDFLVETALLCAHLPHHELLSQRDRYAAYFEAYDIPSNANLYRAYAAVLYNYAKILKHDGKYEYAIQLIDEKKELQQSGYVRHMMEVCRADILVAWAKTEEDPKRSALLDEAERTLEEMQW